MILDSSPSKYEADFNRVGHNVKNAATFVTPTNNNYHRRRKISVEPQNPCPVVVTEVVMMKNDVIIKIDELIT
ncbi:hypothetical protein ACHWQZ_G008843 [Mnemiopsis leidyi]